MGAIYINNQVINQRRSPAIYQDILANRPNPGYFGRLFVADDSPYNIYLDLVTEWVQVGSGGGGGSGTVLAADEGLILTPDGTTVEFGSTNNDAAFTSSRNLNLNNGNTLTIQDISRDNLQPAFIFDFSVFQSPWFEALSSGLSQYKSYTRQGAKVFSAGDSFITCYLGDGGGGAPWLDWSPARLQVNPVGTSPMLDITETQFSLINQSAGHNVFIVAIDGLKVFNDNNTTFCDITNDGIVLKNSDGSDSNVILNSGTTKIKQLTNNSNQYFLQAANDGSIFNQPLPTSRLRNVGNVDTTLTADDYNILFSALTADVTLTLPDPTSFGLPQYFQYGFSDGNSGGFSINTAGYNINGAANPYPLNNPYGNLKIYTDTTQWLLWS